MLKGIRCFFVQPEPYFPGVWELSIFQCTCFSFWKLLQYGVQTAVFPLLYVHAVVMCLKKSRTCLWDKSTWKICLPFGKCCFGNRVLTTGLLRHRQGQGGHFHKTTPGGDIRWRQEICKTYNEMCAPDYNLVRCQRQKMWFWDTLQDGFIPP